MIKGIQIDYKLKPNTSSRFNQRMFGRITSVKKRKDGLKGYYMKGVLHNIPHYRIFEGRIFVATCNGEPDFDPVMEFFSAFQTASVVKDEYDIMLKTGKQKWEFHTKERGVYVDW